MYKHYKTIIFKNHSYKISKKTTRNLWLYSVVIDNTHTEYFSICQREFSQEVGLLNMLVSNIDMLIENKYIKLSS